MGRSSNFFGNKYFSIGVDSASCKIEGCDYKYKPQNETALFRAVSPHQPSSGMMPLLFRMNDLARITHPFA